MALAPAPEREVFEQEIHTIVYGDMSEIARLVRFDLSTVSRAFNPQKPERHNPFFLCAIYLWALDYLNKGQGDAVLNIILREREKWLADDVVIQEQPGELTKGIGEQLFEAIDSELKGMPIDDQIREYSDVRNAVTAKLNALQSRRVVEKYQGRVSNNVRQIGADLVAKKQAS